MRSVLAILLLLALPALGAIDRLATVRTGLQQLSIDSSQSWRVRELEVSLGGAKIYFTEGVLAFATPIDGHRVAAVFTTSAVDAGDAEVIALPPIPAERSSLAQFTQSPNLDEHFQSALLFFSDDAADNLLRQIHQRPLHAVPELASDLSSTYGENLRKGASEIDVRITQSILDHHGPGRGFFYGMMAGRNLGTFDLIFQPDQPDPLVFGRVVTVPSKPSYFQIWSAFRPRALPDPPLSYQLTDYHIDTVIHPDLSMSASAEFNYLADADDGAVIALLMTPRLHVTSAAIDGKDVPVLMHDSPLTSDVSGAAKFLLINQTPLPSGSHHRVQIRYGGTVIRRSSGGTYFVDDRNAWYPFTETMLTVFDLTFHCPESLRLVATGEPLSEDVANGQRTVHRRTAAVQFLAGFNLGQFEVARSQSQPYSIEICSNPSTVPAPDLAAETALILHYFSARWMPLSTRSLAITPIEGYFGQGFPGLIYLSTISYLRERDRPSDLRSSSFDAFFSQLLLPHELAHQWWGNLVTPLDYRSTWIVEALSNYAALQYLEQTKGRPVLDAILAGYRSDLITQRSDGTLIDSKGPVTFGQRLQNNFGIAVWHDILYEKGTWIFHLLRSRMGDARFHDFELRLLHDFAKRPISNEDLRKEAAYFIPADQPDPKLTLFFDTWVYDTGIPTMSVKRGNLKLSGVPEGFTVDIPLQCGQKAGPTWVRATEGEASLPDISCLLPKADRFLFRN